MAAGVKKMRILREKEREENGKIVPKRDFTIKINLNGGK